MQSTNLWRRLLKNSLWERNFQANCINKHYSLTARNNIWSALREYFAWYLLQFLYFTSVVFFKPALSSIALLRYSCFIPTRKPHYTPHCVVNWFFQVKIKFSLQDSKIFVYDESTTFKIGDFIITLMHIRSGSFDYFFRILGSTKMVFDQIKKHPMSNVSSLFLALFSRLDLGPFIILTKWHITLS